MSENYHDKLVFSVLNNVNYTIIFNTITITFLNVLINFIKEIDMSNSYHQIPFKIGISTQTPYWYMNNKKT